MLSIKTSDLKLLVRDFEKQVRIGRLGKKYHLSHRGLFQALVEARRQNILRKGPFARLLLREISLPFPQDPEARFKAVLSCLNTELKQACLLELESYPRTYVEVGKKLAADANVTLPSLQCFSSYFSDSLVPAGLAVEEQWGRGFGLVRRYFGLSKAGIKYGQPLAAFSLRYAVDHEVSLYALLGQSHSSMDSTSPYNRIRIVELVSNGHSRMVDLMGALRLNIEDVRQHLDKLQRLGILKYDSLDLGRGEIKAYTWTPGRSPQDAKTVRELKKLTGRVAAWLYLHKRGGRNEIAAALGHKHPTNISQVLAGLVEQGLARTPFTSTDKSKITLLPGSRAISDYAQDVRNALRGGPELRMMREMLKEFRRDEEARRKYLDAGLELYMAISPSLDARTGGERENELLEFVRKYASAHGRGPRPVDVAKGLGWSHGIVTIYLGSLIAKRVLLKRKKGPAVTYRVC
jgi:hypothetical protein